MKIVKYIETTPLLYHFEALQNSRVNMAGSKKMQGVSTPPALKKKKLLQNKNENRKI